MFGCWLWGALTPGLDLSVLPTAAHPSLTWLLSSWLACALEFFWSWLLGSTFWCCSPPCLASFPPHLPPLSPVHPTGYLPTCMNATGILISAIRTAVSSLRAIASTLEAAISGYEAAAQSAPVPSGISLPSVDLDLEGSLLSASSAGFPSQGLSASRASSHDDVAQLITSAPPACHQLCVSIGASAEERSSRVQRAWEAGHWAKATLEGIINKPRPTPKLANRPTVYVILKAPGLARPVRVSTAAEYFKIIPRFTEGSESVSHAFPSLAEARVYCIAAGVSFPEPAEQ